MVKTVWKRSERGMLTADMIVAMGLLVIALIPISFSYLKEHQLCRAYYERAVLTQVIDGEMEVLAAGEWRVFKEGQQDYPVSTAAMTNLPPGKFVLNRAGNNLRLEWYSGTGKEKAKLVRKAVGQ